MNDIAFRKRNQDFSSKDNNLSVKDINLKKNKIEFKKNNSDTKEKKNILDELEKRVHEEEAGSEQSSGFRKKERGKIAFRTKSNAGFTTRLKGNVEEPDNLYSDNQDNDIFSAHRIDDNFIDYEYQKKRPEGKKIRKSRNRMIINRAKRNTKKGLNSIKGLISSNINNDTDINNPEYRGNSDVNVRQAEKGLVRTIGATAAVIIKIFISALTSILGWIGIAAVVLIGGTVIIIQNVTYDFIVDEDRFFRENISRISSEFTDEITTYANENGCSSINVNGELTEWKYIISFFWTLRNNYSKHEQYDNLLSGDDYADMKEIFNEFNVVEYEIEDMGEEKVLKVNITNKTLEEMEKYWLFSSDQKAYLENLIAADELWDGILGMNGMATLAYSELGQTGDRYYDILSLSDGDEWSIAFVYYLLNECGYVGDNYVRKTTSIESFRQYCNTKGWMTLKPVIGDIAFLSINGEDRVGIISNIEDNYIYLILGNYDRAGIVKEIYVSKTSGILTGAFVHINLPDAVMSLKQDSFMLVGNGECLWPVPGNYYVTSTFGPRWGTVHQGMDISCPEGTPVVAAKSGTVSLSYRSNSAGEYIVIDHGDGMCTEYMHNSLRLVSVGDYVEAGQVIAYSGNTGQSTGPHCHFGVRINGTRVDPAPYLGIPLKLGDVSEYVTGE